ncbi:MAG: isochorismatase family protein, partial [Anaerolineae bacterium]|nr:isochorismatase family protein [Anaerolineae bacterium]
MATDGREFLNWLAGWAANLPESSLQDLVVDPRRVAVLSVDLVKGFWGEGPHASPPVVGIDPAAVSLFERSYALGVRDLLLSQDAHDPDALEFSAYALHAVAGSTESETVEELGALPFTDEFVILENSSISTSMGTDLLPWIEVHPEVRTFIIVGDCTDLCVPGCYGTPDAGQCRGLARLRVIVPANCVQTYDVPV